MKNVSYFDKIMFVAQDQEKNLISSISWSIDHDMIDSVL